MLAQTCGCRGYSSLVVSARNVSAPVSLLCCAGFVHLANESGCVSKPDSGLFQRFLPATMRCCALLPLSRWLSLWAAMHRRLSIRVLVMLYLVQCRESAARHVARQGFGFRALRSMKPGRGSMRALPSRGSIYGVRKSQSSPPRDRRLACRTSEGSVLVAAKDGMKRAPILTCGNTQLNSISAHLYLRRGQAM